MKPMFLLIAVGVISLGITYYIGNKYFDGVVDERTYEASLAYDENTKNIKEMEKAFSNINLTKTENLVTVSFNYNPENTLFSDAKIEGVKLVRPVGVSTEFILNNVDDKYVIDKDIPKGFYHLKILCIKDDTSIIITKNLYVD